MSRQAQDAEYPHQEDSEAATIQGDTNSTKKGKETNSAWKVNGCRDGCNGLNSGCFLDPSRHPSQSAYKRCVIHTEERKGDERAHSSARVRFLVMIEWSPKKKPIRARVRTMSILDPTSGLFSKASSWAAILIRRSRFLSTVTVGCRV